MAAIYVRYRQGGAILASDTEKTNFNEGVNQEYSKCKKTSKDWLAARSGCLEVFFLDRGVGLVNHFNTNSDSQKKVLDKVMRQTFFEGKSNKSKRKTEHGGLFLLHELMKRSTDYIRVLDEKTWFGCAVPIDRQTANLTEDNDVPYGITGLAYHLRLGWKASTEDDQTWLKFNTEEVNHIWAELSRTPESCQELFNWFNDCSIWDERFENIAPPKNIKSKFVLWLPKPNRMKWDVLNRLEVLSKQITGTCFLIIADISSIEAAVYKAAMSNSSFHPNEDWPKKIQTIALSTNRWSFAFAEHEIKENKRHGFSTFSKKNIEGKFKEKVKISKKIIGNISFRELIVHMLKWHDSQLLWDEVAKNKRLFVAEKVKWNGVSSNMK